MQDPEAEPSYTDAQLYSKAEKRVAELRIAVREDGEQFGWINEGKKLPTVLVSSSRVFNAMPLQSSLGFPFAAPNKATRLNAAGQPAAVAKWKKKTDALNAQRAMVAEAAAKAQGKPAEEKKEGEGQNAPAAVGRLGLRDTAPLPCAPPLRSMDPTQSSESLCSFVSGPCFGDRLEIAMRSGSASSRRPSSRPSQSQSPAAIPLWPSHWLWLRAGRRSLPS